MLAGMPEHRFVHRDLVQFSETDMAGIVHFSNFFRFMERTEHAFFRSLGLSIVERPGTIPTMEGNPVGWPRVHASCDFFTPLFFEDEVEVELLVEELRTRSIRYLFRVRKLDGTLAAEGRIAAVCVQKDKEKGGMKAVEIPARVKDKLETAPAEVLGARKGQG
jgi:acyl-CoA thioester hydrolase